MQEGQSVRCAAEFYHVPRSTLFDRVSGRVVFGAKSGPSKYLSDKDEEELVNFLSGCAAVGDARSKRDITALVQEVNANKGLHRATVTDGWGASFKRRHGNLTLRMAEPLSYAQAVASSPEIIDHYYDLLEQTLVDNDLVGKPMQLFNMDETAMPLDPTPTKVVVLKGTKHPTSVTSGNKAQITVVACCNAASYVMPPMVVFDCKTLKPEMAFGEVPATVYGLSKKGWMDSELFHLWFTQHFLVHAPPTRPLLLMDGHSTHFEPNVIRKAAEGRVILFCLPPHTTHLLQPLDKGCFGPLKVCWRRECQAYLRRNPGKVMTQFEFSRVFSQAWFQGMSMSTVIAGFRTTGVYPFDRHAIQPANESGCSYSTGVYEFVHGGPARNSCVTCFSPLR